MDGPNFQNMVEATSGPRHRASAPSDRNVPKMIPFDSLGPWLLAMVVRHGTTMADETEYNPNPKYSWRSPFADPISKKDGIMILIPCFFHLTSEAWKIWLISNTWTLVVSWYMYQGKKKKHDTYQDGSRSLRFRSDSPTYSSLDNGHYNSYKQVHLSLLYTLYNINCMNHILFFRRIHMAVMVVVSVHNPIDTWKK